MTYSNTIDPKLPLCPDELAGNQCPRGSDCMYQHFDMMLAPGTSLPIFLKQANDDDSTTDDTDHPV